MVDLVAVCLGTFMLLDITIVNVALPDIQRALNSSFSDLQWIVDAYALTLAAFLLTAGSLADMFGRRLLYWPAWRFSPSRRCCAALPSVP
jgi:MFS family permease